MKPRSGNLQRTGYGFRLRIAVNGKTLYFPLKSTDEQEARAEAQPIIDRLQGSDTSAITDALRGALQRLEKTPEASGMPLSSLWPSFVASKKRKPAKVATMEVNESYVSAFVAWAAPMTATGQVTPAVAERYAAHLDDAVDQASHTVNKKLQALRMVWSVAVGGVNPWLGLKSSRKDGSIRHEAFTDDMLKRILNQAGGELRDVLAVMAYTGLRQADAVLLKASSVYFSRNVIECQPVKMSGRGASPMRAKVGIHYALLPILQARDAAVDASGHLFPELASLYQADRTMITRRVQRVLVACGIETQVTVRGKAQCVYGSHSFRHTVQSRLIEAMVHPLVIDVILAHRSAGVSGTYSHISDTQVNEAIGKLPDWLVAQGQLIEMRAG